MDVFFLGGGGGVKNEMRDLAGGSLHFATVYNFLQIQFCHVLLLLGGGNPNVTYNFWQSFITLLYICELF